MAKERTGFTMEKQFQRRDELTSEEVSLYGVWGSAIDDVYIVGSHGTILHFDGNEEGEWKPMESGTEEYLFKRVGGIV